MIVEHSEMSDIPGQQRRVLRSYEQRVKKHPPPRLCFASSTTSLDYGLPHGRCFYKIIISIRVLLEGIRSFIVYIALSACMLVSIFVYLYTHVAPVVRIAHVV